METERLTFQGSDITIIGDAAGPPDGQPVVFLHGSGQTRHSWRKSMKEAANRGFRAIAFDLRGHGETDWSPDRRYHVDQFIADMKAVVEQIGRAPILVGTSAGGLVSLATAATPPPAVRAIIVIDISPQVQMDGVAEVRGFMGSAAEGFASLDEAADAVAAFMPHRPRPKDTSGLARNLRLRDGRYYWHWDPEFFAQMAGHPDHVARSMRIMREASSTLKVPTLLIRGGSSAVVSEEGARAFLELFPHAEHVDIAGAHHTVAGDANDAFNNAILGFLAKQAAEPAASA